MSHLSAPDLARAASCLKSRVARRILIALSSARGPIGITALCRKVGCSRRDAIRYLALLRDLGVVCEERAARLRLIRLRDTPISNLVVEAARLMEVEGDEC
ncbi:MAG: HTH domain-containing protein [Candidatus Bathyarchaeia archaeon]